MWKARATGASVKRAAKLAVGLAENVRYHFTNTLNLKGSLAFPDDPDLSEMERTSALPFFQAVAV